MHFHVMRQLLIENDFLLYGIGGMRAPVPRTSVAPSVGTGTFRTVASHVTILALADCVMLTANSLIYVQAYP